MADQHDVAAILVMAFRLAVHLADQGACRVDVKQVTPLSLRRHRFRHPVGGKDHGHVRRHLVQLLDEDGAFGLQVFDDETIVHDLMPDIDRCPELLQRPFDDLDGPVDARAEAARRGQ